MADRIEIEINHTVRLPGDEYSFIKPAVRVSSPVGPDDDPEEVYEELRELGSRLWLQELMRQSKEAMGLSEADSLGDFIAEYAEALDVE